MSAVEGKPRTGKAPEVVCFGILVADLVGTGISALPERGRMTYARGMELSVGGCAANSAIALARLGVSVAVVGKVGRDPLGDFMVARLQRDGVDVTSVRRDASSGTSATMVIVAEDGERSFIHYRGANASLDLDDVPWDAVSRSRILHVAGTHVMPSLDGEPTGRLLHLAKERGLMTSLDTTWDATGTWRAIPERAFADLDVFLPSIEEARAMTGRHEAGEVARLFLERGVGIVALKMGEQGCLVMTPHETLRLPAFKVRVLDTTGAGDAFAGGFLAGLAKGWDLHRTARLATAAGACCVEETGATTGLPSLERVVERFGI
ncbi:MAG: sugar kinase [Planctomycetota bacterium]